jgi:hypothetical protein
MVARSVELPIRASSAIAALKCLLYRLLASCGAQAFHSRSTGPWRA